MKKKYEAEKGSSLWRHKMREAYKAKGMKPPDKFKLSAEAKTKALKKKMK